MCVWHNYCAFCGRKTQLIASPKNGTGRFFELIRKHEKTASALRIKAGKFLRKLTATQIVVLSFVVVILTGALLLMLPASHAEGASQSSFLDALFTAVSATCVTGLVTLTTAAQWSVFGQIVILCMIQIGGLSLVTLFAFVLVYMGKKVGMRSRMTIQASMNQNTMQGLVRMVMLAIRGTFLIEGIAAVVLFLFFWLQAGVPAGRAVYFGIFHAISSFCNAGFDVIGETSLQQFVGHPLLNGTVMMLIVLGGIGFTVWKDILRKLAFKLQRKEGARPHFTLQSKLAIASTVALLLVGTLYFLLAEFKNPETLGPLSWPVKILAAMFQSVTLRTAGFFTISQNGLSEASKFVSSILMLIGGSPGGTAGGIKTVTIAVIVCSVWSTLCGRHEINVLGRRIPERLFQRAITVLCMIVSLWVFVSLLLKFTEADNTYAHTFMDLLFEAASALGTVGVTTGITPHLSGIGKALIIMCMFVGRLGPISIVVSMQRRLNANRDSIHYPEEETMIG